MHRFYPSCLLFFTLLITAALPAQCPITVDAGDDIYLCAPPTPVQLNGSIDGPYLNFTWSPTTGMTGASTLSPTVNVTTSMTYVLTARAADLNNNLIVNGDFESGNSGFSSSYIYSPGDLVPEGVYDVLADPSNDHPNFAACPDHTSGGGNMMAVNGAATPNLDVWCQTVPVTPNTQYVFSTWVTTLVASSPARLQFSINGGVIGPIFNAPSTTCQWLNFYTTWNSGANSSATICIVNQNTVAGGNDFALDDIVFSPVCVVKDSVKVQVVNIQAAASPPVSIIPCNGSNITLSGVGSSTGTNISYNWDSPNGNIVSGQNTLNPVVNAGGTYTLTVTFNNGFVECTKTASVNVIESPNPLSAWITPPPPLGCGSPTVLLLGNSSQPAFSTYLWTASAGGNIVSGQNSPTATINHAGEYTLLVTNTSTGCTAEANVTVLAATNPPVAVATVSGPITCQNPTANISGTGSSTGNNITYHWVTLVGGNLVSGQNTPNAVVNGQGTYVLTVTNTSNGCTAVDTAIVQSTATPPNIGFAPAGVFNCAIDTLLLSATLSPATATPAWTASGGGAIVAGANTLTPQITGAGNYILLATDPATGCTATDTIAVSANLTPPTAVGQPADTITCQQPSIHLSGAGSSTGANFIYHWTADGGGNIVSGDTTLTPLVNAAAVYQLLVTNTTNACTATATVTVAADANAIVAVANAPNILTCTDTVVALNTTGSSAINNLTYAWSTSDGIIITGGDTPAPTVGAPGTYQLLLTNPANGCTATDLATVTQDIAHPDLAIVQPDTLTCAHPQLILQGQNNSPAGTFAFHWTASNGGSILSGDTTLAPVINAAGTYTLTATNLINGCSAQVPTTVAIETGTPVALIATPGPITCAQPSFSLNTAGSSSGPNFSFNWAANGGGNILSGANSPNPVVNAPGNYALTITNISNGCTTTASIPVTQDIAIPATDAGPNGLLTCFQPLYSLSANNGQAASGMIIHWQTPDGHIIGSADSATIQTDQPGLYLLSILNPQNGCSATDSALVTANQLAPAVGILPAAKLTCVQKTAALNTSSANPNLSYQWQTTGGQFVSGQSTAAPVVNAPGLYQLTVTDPVNGCTNTAAITVNQDIAIPLAVAGASPTLTCTKQQATLQGQVEPGAGINVLWTSGNGHFVSGATTATPSVDQPGDYLLTVSNTANGCTNTAQVNVAQNIALPVVNAGLDDTLSCTVSSLTLSATGTAASGMASYNWTAGAGGHFVSGTGTLAPVIDAPGVYTLLITDLLNGCTATDAVTVLNDANAPNAAVAAPGPLTCATQQLTLQGFGSIGANFTHAWSTSGTGNIVSGGNTLNALINAPGTYILKVTNLANGCTATAQVTVNQNLTLPATSIAAPGTLSCSTKTLSLSGAPSGAGYTYFWQTVNGFIVSGGNTPNPVINKAGDYTLTVMDQTNGCTASATIPVNADLAPPVLSIAAPQTLTCIVLQIPLDGIVSQPAANFSTNWVSTNGHFVSGQNTLSPKVDKPGDYVLTVQNLQNGCTTTVSATVQQNTTPPVAKAGPAPTITCAQPQVSLDGSASSGQGNLSYAWGGGQIGSGAQTAAPLVLVEGPYTLTVTDAANGCTDTDVVTVLKNTTPPLVAIAPPALLTCLRDTVSLDAGNSSSGANFTRQWSTSGGHFSGGQNTLLPTVDATGTYILVITNQQNGCSTTASASVGEDRVKPVAEAGPPDQLHCKHPQTSLQGSSTTAGSLSFLWSTSTGNILNGAATASPEVNAPGQYLLTVTDLDNGCTATDEVSVSAIPLPDFAPVPDQPNCHHPKGSIDIGPVTGGAAPFSYSFNGGQSFQGSPTAANLGAGTYGLIVRDANGCTAEAQVELFQAAFPSVKFPDIYQIEQGDSVQLKPVTQPPAVVLADWQWTPATGLSCDDCPEPWAKPLRPTTYTLVITDQNGCTAQNTVLLRVDRSRQLYAPNIISPNGDGKNDVFLLFGKAVEEVQYMRIFDRWGNQLFENEHFSPNVESEGWNGTFRGKNMQPGVYVWQAAVKFIDGEVEIFAGDVTIYR